MDGIFLADEDGIYVAVNASGHAMLGYEPGELIGKPIALITLPHELGRVTENFAILDQGKTLLQEWQLLRKDGSLMQAEMSIQKLNDGLVMAQVRDISVRKLVEFERIMTEAKLRDSEARFRSYFELPFFGIAITSLEKGWVDVNDRLCEMFGYTRDELKNLTWSELTFPEDLSADVAQFNRVLKGETEGYGIDKRFVKKDGSIFPTSLSVRCVRKPDGPVNYFVAVIQDISERKQVEQQLLQSQKVESIGRLAGGVAHDFNNLLTSMLGFSEFALNQLPDDSPARPNIERVIESAKRGAALTQQLLAFARKKIVRPEPLNLNRVIEHLLPLLRRLIGEHIELAARHDPALGTVLIDAGSIEQVLVNLAVNARDAMPNGGSLTLETRSTTITEPEPTDPDLKPGEYVQVAVRDTGSGMTPEVLAHAFEPFFTTKPTGQGTGLGLSMCHGILKQAGGHISIESEIGRGTSVNLFLPKVQHTPAAARTEKAVQQPHGGTESVLIVEDEPLIREFSLIALSRLGYRVSCASNGAEALELAQTLQPPPDLLITDVVMPKMGGNDLAARLARVFPQMKIVFVSGYTDDAMALGGVLDEDVHFIQKPYTAAVLASTIRTVLDKR